MNFKTTCIKCIKEKDYEERHEYTLELRDDRVYPLTCDKGHESVVILSNNTFELLFEMGLYALNDGYCREAVANFASAIERFYEFCITVIAKEKLNTFDFIDHYPVAWKSMGLSERQLGAFIMLYLLAFKKAPDLLSDKQVNFRNSVIHRGKFPTYDETVKYAKATFEHIKEKLVELKTELSESVEYIYEKQLRDYITKNDVNGKHILNVSELTTFRCLRPLEEIQQIDFEESLEARKEMKFFK